MDSILKPIEQIRDDMKWFVANTHLRAVHASVSAELMSVVLSQIQEAELHPRNRELYLTCAQPGSNDASWGDRCDALRNAFDEVSKVAVGLDASQPVAFGRLAELDPRMAPLSRFGVRVRDIARATDAPNSPMSGIVVVLSPTEIHDMVAWTTAVVVLLRQPLPRVRWVLVEDTTAPSRAQLTKCLGPALLASQAVLDPALQRKDLQAMLGALKATPVGATGLQAAGMPGPRCSPPRRLRASAPPEPGQREAVLREAGVPEGYADDAGLRQLQIHMMSAALAFGDGDALTGIREQRAACDQAKALGLSAESVVLEQMLGAHTLQAGFPEQARSVFESAYQRAEALGLGRQMVLARIAIAGTWTLQGKNSVAVVQYAEAARLAAERGETVLAIEGYRVAGQLLANERRTEEAAQLWQRALQVAKAGEPLDVSMSSAPHVARALAAMCRSHGLLVQAASLEEQAVHLEAPPVEPPEASVHPQDTTREGA